MAFKVFINPGHSPNGDPDPGACNVGMWLRECDIVQEVGDLVASYLSAAGVKVRGVLQTNNLSGEDASQPELIRAVNDSDANLFLSLHCNSASNPAARGTECLVCYADSTAEDIARYIQHQIVSSVGTVDRGIKYRPELIVLRLTNMPAVLVEMAFLSSEPDAVMLRDCKDEFARAIARGVTDYLCNASE